MPLIVHNKDPFDATKSDKNIVSNGCNLLDWMCKKYGDVQSMSGGLSTDIILNGKIILQTDKNFNETDVDIVLGQNDYVNIINRPAGFDPFTLALIAVAVVASAALIVALTPSYPGDAGQAKSSPNNSLQAATNSFRVGQAIPEIFGNVVSFPDFIQPSYFEYVGNLKIVSELFCVGVGDADIVDVKSGETLINTITGSSSTIYAPGVTPAAELLTIHRGTNEVDGQVLVSPDELSQNDQVGQLYLWTATEVAVELIIGSTLVADLGLVIGDYITIVADPSLISGTFLINDITVVLGLDTIVLNTIAFTPGTATTSIITKTDSGGNVDNWLGWFDIPGDQADEVWFHWQMPQGIRSEDSNQISIDLELEIQRTVSGVPTGPVIAQSITKTGNTQDPQFTTTKFTGLTVSQYRARQRRVTNLFAGSAGQQIKVEDFVSVTPYTATSFGDVTLLSVERKATTFAITSSSSKINCDYTRKLPAYDRGLDFYNTGLLVATRDFADSVAYEIIVASGRSASTVDLVELYAINDALTADLRQFDFTFDDFNVSLGERVQSICNVARVSAYRDGAVWRFTRDEVKPFRQAIFNRRNIPSANSSTQGWQLQRPDDKDSISLTYVDPDDNVERTIYRRVSGGVILSDLPGNQPLEIKLAGCRNLAQADNRADLEIRRIIYQRRTVNDTVMRDGLLVGLNSRVGWVDPNDTDLFDGEILGFTGDDFDTSERWVPKPATTYTVFITDNDGNPSNTVIATPRLDTEFGFTAVGLIGTYLPTGSEQAGSRYVILNGADNATTDFLITRRSPNSDGTVQLEMAEYVNAMYEND